MPKNRPKVLILNGPNLNLLGQRQSDIYGTTDLETIQKEVNKEFGEAFSITWKQSQQESQLVEWVQKANDQDALIINPGAFSHYGLSLLDALLNLKIPIIEVHLSQVYQREPFRQTMLTAKAATMIMCGLGKDAYRVALYSLRCHRCNKR